MYSSFAKFRFLATRLNWQLVGLRTSHPFSSAPTSRGGNPTLPAPLPVQTAPPYQTRSMKISYETTERTYQRGRRREPKFIFKAEYENNGQDKSQIRHEDEVCRRCQTMYYKRYVIPKSPLSIEKDKEGTQGQSTTVHRELKLVEARGEVRKVCEKCRQYLSMLMDDVKNVVRHIRTDN